MMMGGMGGPPLANMLDARDKTFQSDNKLTISWVDSSWVPHLSSENVMSYFSDRRNPFYDVQCNNEMVKMQQRSLDQLPNMIGVEYCLLYVQEPILYVIRKQQRHSPSHVTPMSDYYIVGGTIYQAPDLCSVVNSRLLSAVNHMQAAFDEAKSYARYHPNKGYWWDFQQASSSNTPYGAKKITPPPDTSDHAAGAENDAKKSKKKKKKSEAEIAKEEPSSVFQRVRVDYLLKLLTDKFPPPQIKKVPHVVPTPATSAGADKSATADQDTVKSEKVDNISIKSEDPPRSVKREAASGSRPMAEANKKMKFS